LCCDLISHNLGVMIKADDRRMLIEFTDKENNEFEIIMLRSTDIPTMIEEKNIDMGITGNDYFIESGRNIIESNDLFMFNGLLCVLAKKDSEINSLDDLKGNRKNVCCSQYPNLSLELLKRKKAEFADVKIIDGAAESYLKLGLCEIIVDIVTTGTTFIRNDLKIVDSIMPVSTHIYFNNEYMEKYKEFCNEICYKLSGRKMISYERNKSRSIKNYQEFLEK